jgi:transcriptional regulator with XRE-family HTH domain
MSDPACAATHRNVAIRIRELRLQKCLSLADLAERIGKNPSSLSRIEAGKCVPRPDTLGALARALDVAPGVLTGEGDAPALPPDLSSAEVELLSWFRRLPPQKQERALGIIQGLAVSL